MTTNWSANVYSQEHKAVRITNFNASTVMVRLTLSSPISISADYVVPTSRVLEIDVTDIVRLAQSGTFYLSGYNSSGSIVSADVATCSWSTAGLVNPYKDIIPPSELLEKWTAIADEQGDDVEVDIAPPVRILEQLGQPIILEIYHDAQDVVALAIPSETMLNATDKTITIPYNLHAWSIQNRLAQLTYGDYGVTERDGCRNYCVVRWTSRYGVQKQFVWEYRDLRVKVSETVDIETIDGAYDERKGYVQGLTLYLDELNQYDYWYYSDIVTSSSVEVLIAGTWYAVQVENKDVTIPNFDTGEPNKLEVQINIRKYDAI